ncbi:MAG: choice-of-anchor L domain-containing protein [Bacteroidota bacterium]
MRKIYFFTLVIVVLFILDLADNKAVAQFNLIITKCADSAAVIALIDSVFLDGVNPNQFKNISFTGDPEAVGYFTNGYIFGFSNPSGIVMGTGFVEDFDEPNNCSNYSNGNTSGGSDPDLVIAAGGSIFDACVIEFDFMPTGDTAKFNYVFGSEEYHEWVSPAYNDVFGFFLSGPGINGTYSNGSINIAIIPGTNLPVKISNINCGDQDNACTPPPGSGPNCQFLNDNTNQSNGSFQQTTLDAYTDAFSAGNETESCGWYHIKLAIGDYSDPTYDSGVFLEKGSFDPGSMSGASSYTHPTIDSILYESCGNNDAIVYFSISTPRTDPFKVGYSVEGSATRDIDYLLFDSGHGDTIYIAPGALYDSIIIRPFYDTDVEGIEDIQIIYSPVMCPPPFGGPDYDTTFVYLSDVPDFADTNKIIQTYCEDVVTVSFDGMLNGIPPYDYLWTAGGQTTSTLEYIISGTDSVFLHCVVTDTCGYDVSDTAFIIVPNLITDAGPNKSLCNRPDVQLDGTSPGAQDFFWTSNPNDPTLAGQENDSTPIVTPIQTTEYILLATDNCTNSSQDTTMVDLDGAVANASANTQMCLTDSVTLSCNLSSFGETYIWMSIPVDAGLASQATNQIIKVSPLTDTKYYVNVTDACNYQANDSVEVIVYSLPTANAGSNDEVCFGTSYNLVATGGVSYQWGSIPADPSLLVNQQDTTANPTITPDTQINYKYYVEVTNQVGCTTTDTMELTVNFVPDVSLSPDVDIICFGETVTITSVGDVADDYAWTSTPSDPTMVVLSPGVISATPEFTTTYSLVATVGGINCPATPEQEITVIPQLTANFAIVDNKILTCENEAIGIYYTGNATGSANYTWDFDAEAIINSGSGFATDPYSVQWTTEGPKTISLYLDENGCPSDTTQIDVTVFSMPLPDFSAIPENGCAELEVSFTNLSSKLDDPTYTWTIDGTMISDFETTYTFTNPGTYTVSLATTNQSICSRMETKLNHITVFEVPSAFFEADPPETIIDDGIINFINNSTSQDIMTYKWDFDDGDSSSMENPEHKYDTEGVYIVWLTATTLNGCENKFSSEVIVHPDFSVYPPNAFTPNGDGENDVFYVKGTGVSEYVIRIFSRWGELVYESAKIEDSWDGTYKGSLVSAGAYAYTINYRSMLNKEYTITGTVTVIR